MFFNGFQYSIFQTRKCFIDVSEGCRRQIMLMTDYNDDKLQVLVTDFERYRRPQQPGELIKIMPEYSDQIRPYMVFG